MSYGLTPTQNVLDNQLKLDQSAALQGQTRQNALNALSSGVESMVTAPARFQAQENALAMQGQQLKGARVQGAEAERQYIAKLIQGVKRAPPEMQAQVYGQMVRQAEADGLEIPDWAEDFNNFGVIDSVYSMPPEKQTVFQQQMGALLSGNPDVVQAARTALGQMNSFTLSPGQTRFLADGTVQGSVAPAAGDRKIIKGADDQNYYADTGEPVLGGVDAKPKERKIVNVAGVPYYADTQAPVIEGLTADQAASFKDEQSMRKEWTALTKDFRSIRDAYTKVIGSAENASAAGDMALIFNYMKMLDPGSVVREGEFATAQNAAGVPDRLRNTYNNIVNGERLNPAQRQDFMKTAGQVFEGQNELYERDLGKYRDIARGYGFNPEAAVPSLPIIRQPSESGGQLMIDPQTGQKWRLNPDGSYQQVE